MPRRQVYDDINGALGRALEHLSSINPPLAALVSSMPYDIDPDALQPVVIRGRRCVYGRAFLAFPACQGALAIAHGSLHVILGHDYQLEDALRRRPGVNARLFNLACDLSVAAILAPLADDPRINVALPELALSLRLADFLIGDIELERLPFMIRFGLENLDALANAPPPTIYAALSRLPPDRIERLLQAPATKPLSDDLRPNAATTDPDADATTDLSAVARHLCFSLVRDDHDGVIAQILRHLTEPSPARWRARLRSYLERAANPASRVTFARPDRRHRAYRKMGLYQPAREKMSRRPIAAIIDTNSAVPHHVLTDLQAELRRTHRSRPVGVHVILSSNPQVPPTQLPPAVPQNARSADTSRSSLTAAFSAAQALHPSLIVCVSDLFIEPLGRRHADTVFLTTSDRPAPFGTLIRLPTI